MKPCYAIMLSMLCSPLLAATPIEGMYSGAFGGYSYAPNNIKKTTDGLSRTIAKYRGGYNAGGQLGYKSNPMRYEGEVTYIKADAYRFKINGINQTGVSGYTDALLAMANVYLDLPECPMSLSPFLGVGIGYAYVESHLDSTGPNFGFTRFKGSDNVFAYQAMAGITYNFAENFALNIGYRYIATERVKSLGKIFQANLANVGVIYRFDENNYK